MQSLSFVSVVFDAEVALLELQARSIAMHMDPDAVDRIFVLDNCLFGLGARRTKRLLRAYGPFASRVTIVRTRELFDRGSSSGWRSQQAAKLMIARLVGTRDYVTLDAKNHFIRPVTAHAFVAPDGRSRGMSHSYAEHPLLPSLVKTLRYLGADADQESAAIASFPPTATPFVLRTEIVNQIISDIETRSGSSFAHEFEDRKLLEFFLYSGWISVRGGGLPAIRDDSPLVSPIVWPRLADVHGVQQSIGEADATRAFVFAVHRQALARADRAAKDLIIAFWVRVGLFPDRASAAAFVRRFDRAYRPALLMTRAAERLRRISGGAR